MFLCLKKGGKMKITGKTNLKLVLDGAIKIAERTGATIVISGESGSGKTYLINKIAEERGYDILTRVLSNSTLEEIIGVPIIFDENGEKYFDKIIPKWMSPVYDSQNTKPLLLFLDEVNRRVIPEQVLFSILDQKIVPDKKKRENIILIACINSGRDKYNVQELEDRAIKNRLILIEFDMEKKDINIMLDELAKTEKEKIVNFFLSQLLERIPEAYGEMPDMFVSLRNWKNFFYYLVVNNITSYDNFHKFLTEDKLLPFVISTQIINDIKNILHHMKIETKKMIEDYFQKKQTFPITIQLSIQYFFIFELFRAPAEDIEEITLMIKTLFDNATAFSITRHILKDSENFPRDKRKEILLQFNKHGLMENVSL